MPDVNNKKRRDLSRIYGKSVGVFPKKKLANPESLLVEGSLETEYCYHLEFDTSIVEYESQPIGFHYYDEGKRRFYTPDFLITYADGHQEYVEIKYFEDIETNNEFNQDFPLWQKQAEILAIPLVLITDKVIRKEPFFSNIRHLHRASIYPKISKNLKYRSLEIITSTNGIFAHDLLITLGETSIGIIYQLIYEMPTLVNLHTETLGPETLLKRIHND